MKGKMNMKTMAQDTKESKESVTPTFGVTLDRECSDVIIDCKEIYFDVTIELEAADEGERPGGVKVTVKDEKGKELYNKRFEKSYLYYYPSDGTIEVRKGEALTQVVIIKDIDTGCDWHAGILEKGLYK